MNFIDSVIMAPVIGTLHTGDIDLIDKSPCEVFFILDGELSELKALVEKILSQNKQVFVHVDLISGLKSDPAGLRFLTTYAKPTGIITTKGMMVKEAKKLGLQAIQRLFLLDSRNLESGIQSVQKYQPDAVEVLPGVLHKVTKIITESTKLPVITGGLVMDKEDVMQCLQAGAVGVSTSKQKLWSI